MNARATSFYTRRFISGINTKFSCVLHTLKLKHATYKHMRCAKYMHAQYSIHTAYIHTAYILYTVYICYLAAQHTYCIRAHLHMLHMHVACVLHTQYIHIGCMLHTQKLAQRHTHAIQAYEDIVCSLCAIVDMQHVCCT